jgi:hypothetical protein
MVEVLTRAITAHKDKVNQQSKHERDHELIVV